MKRLRLLTLIIVALVALVGAGAYAKRKQDSFTYTPKAHHVIYAEWKQGKLSSIRIRDVEADGRWVEWAVNKESGRTRISDHSKEELSQSGFRSASFFRSRPNLLREQTILGYSCFTLNVDGAQMTYSPEFGETPLRLESKSGTVIEALKIY